MDRVIRRPAGWRAWLRRGCWARGWLRRGCWARGWLRRGCWARGWLRRGCWARAGGGRGVEGYPNSASIPLSVSVGPANLSFAQPWGPWGYLGAAAAQEYGFRAPAGSALSELGLNFQGKGADPSTLPQAEQAAIGKCSTITQDFSNAMQNGPLAGSGTLSNDLYNDVAKDAQVASATRAWVACMARNGCSCTQPGTVFFTELKAMFGGNQHVTPGSQVSAAASQAQIAVAVTDATAPLRQTWPGSTSRCRPATSSRS